MKMRHMEIIKKTVTYILSAIILLFVLFPFYWLGTSSFKTNMEIVTNPTIFPKTFTLTHYINLFSLRYKFNEYMSNSLIVAVVVTLITLLVSLPSAYSIARYRFKGKRLMLRTVLISYATPAVLLIVPLSPIVYSLGLYDTLYSLFFTYPIITIPFTIWILRDFIQSIPLDIEEAAMVDGASRFTVLFRIVFPLILPGVATAAMFSFITAWNEYLFALIFLSHIKNWTLPLGLASYSNVYTIDWGLLSAASFVSAIPSLIFFIPLSKYFIKGLALKGVKG